MTNKSDTPWTDSNEHNMGSVTSPHHVVDSDDVKELERELNALKAENEEIRKRVEQFRLGGRIDDLADAIQAIHEARSTK